MYLPLTELARHGLTTNDIEALRSGARSIDASYRALMEDLIDVADRDYDRAAEAIPHLPTEFRRAAAVSSAVYRGIHGAIRRNGYDNRRRSAYTTGLRKATLAAVAFAGLVRGSVMPTERA
jgi:phytoene/squalene synthetase